MREIKFRGKCIGNGEWVYGFINHFNSNEKDEHWYINVYNNGMQSFWVHPETIGQFTGLKDKNGVDVYENDICSISIISDDSGMAADIFGVESHLNAWVNLVYIETIKCTVKFKNGAFVLSKNNTVNLPIYLDLLAGNIIDEKYQLIEKGERTVKEDDLYLVEVIGNIHETYK